ncbi:MAG: lipocalin family protein [Woeseiaceae bacterium]|nr:lipocalin family protein [Woeseiaceae bacterium]
MPDLTRIAIVAVASLLCSGCATTLPEMKTVDYVDLDRFMGDWFVIANIPTFLEKGAHNAVETYAMNDDGTVATTFTFRDDSFGGEIEQFTPRGFIRDEQSNALWGMRFIWPFKADYRIVYLNDSYTQTIIARRKRDYLWIMARTPTIAEDDLQQLIEFAGSIGYDVAEIQLVPQRWSGTPGYGAVK